MGDAAPSVGCRADVEVRRIVGSVASSSGRVGRGGWRDPMCMRDGRVVCRDERRRLDAGIGERHRRFTENPVRRRIAVIEAEIGSAAAGDVRAFVDG